MDMTTLRASLSLNQFVVIFLPCQNLAVCGLLEGADYLSIYGIYILGQESRMDLHHFLIKAVSSHCFSIIPGLIAFLVLINTSIETTHVSTAWRHFPKLHKIDFHHYPQVFIC